MVIAMMDDGQETTPATIDNLPIKPPVDKETFNRHMMSQRKYHAEALRDIEEYLWRERLITRRIALAARER